MIMVFAKEKFDVGKIKKQLMDMLLKNQKKQ